MTRLRFATLTATSLVGLPLVARSHDNSFAYLPQELRWAGVPGASLALVSLSAIRTAPFGMRDIAAHLPVTASTIFEAGSISKPVFAYAVCALVRSGGLDLHRPLDSYLAKSYQGNADARARYITAHHVLTHTSGLPNWRSENKKQLDLSFDPGTRYLYSGEGFYFLQTVVEQISGQSIEQFMRPTLDALGMHRSAYVWRDQYSADCARPYGSDLRPLPHESRVMGEELVAMGKASGSPFVTWKTAKALAALPKLKPPYPALPHYAMPNVAWSLFTTAHDYGRFVQALMHQPSHPMLVPQLRMSPYIWRGLGIALQIQDDKRAFFHTGSNPGFKAVMFGDLASGRGVVSFANSNNGFAFNMHVLDDAVGEQPAVFYLEAL